MTEPKRATWREFATFMASRCSWPTTEATAMGRTVPLLRSKRDAQIAYAAAYGYGDEDFERDVAAWVDALRAQGISPPVDPPSMAEVLESVAVEVVSAGEHFCADMSGDEARRLSLAFGCATAIVRAKAKEFA